ncbi:MAG: sigma-70 family RNA polymerase sigma factor [Thermoanaerobaculia bacterium]
MGESARRGPLEPARDVDGRKPALFERAIAALLPFFRRWAHGRLPPFARRRMDTGDVVQEAVLGALRNLGEIDLAEPEALRRYLVAAIQNRIRDEVRRARLGEVANSGSPSSPDHGPSPLDEVLEDEHRRSYRRALLRLSDGDRQVLVGRVELHLTYRELAIATGRPSADAARNAARRAALRLGRLMGRDGDDDPAGAKATRTPAGAPRP